MEVTLDIPDSVAKALGYPPELLTRRALESLLIDECSRGHLSRGKIAEILGLSFHETEDLLKQRGLPYPIKSRDDDLRENAALKKPV